MTGATQTAVIVAITAAEPVVSEYRRRFDRAASWGIPAHVSIVFPFVDPADLNEGVLTRLAAAVATVNAFDCIFARCQWFGEDVLWLAPEPADGFRTLTAAVVAAFPQHQPYGGQFDEVVPHLTVGERRRGSTDELRAAARGVSVELPILATVDHAVLVAGTDAPASWRTIRRLPLGFRPAFEPVR
ncbi:2'-5' RNA ligase family protein [uncultured Jatrophihabitans sp.]|uniref:2'-5' RNA ligase family protein n=1 Tax=uncultured Jatrophihabitans sp. TaxID=1610747 RepID=UPI0035CB52AE